MTNHVVLPVKSLEDAQREIERLSRVVAGLLTSTGIGSGGPPTGPASGVLGGNYPDPSFAVDMATQAELNAAVAGLTAGPSIITVGITTAVLANNATEQGTVAIASAARSATLQLIEGSVLCWIRLYTTAAARAADSLRVLAVDPTAGTGLLSNAAPGEDGAGLVIEVTPSHELHNGDGPRAGVLYYAITNLSGGTTAVTVTLTVLSYP